MTRALAVVVLVAAAAAPVAAESRKLMVLPADGRADAKLKQKVDAAIAKLAKASGETVAIGEVSYNDMAAAVGCKPDESSCRDEVIATLAVDEIVITAVNPKPGGFDVNVRRVAKGSPSAREASMLVTADKADQLDAIAPVFGAKAAVTAPPPAAPKPAVTAPPPAAPKPAVTAPQPPAPRPAVTAPPPAPPATTASTTGAQKPYGPPPAPVSEPAPPPKPAVAPAPRVAEQPPANNANEPQPGEPSDRRFWSRRRVQVAGMATGGAMLVVGFVLWGKASDYQNQVDAFPTPIRSRAQLQELQDLENQGDAYATWRTVFVVGGLAVGGVSTYLFFHGRHGRAASHASLTPTLFDHGAGLAFTFGGSP